MNMNNELDSKLELSGFKNVDRASMILVRRVVDGTLKKFNDNIEGFEKLKFTLKEVHGTEKSVKYQIMGSIIVRNAVQSVETVDRNLFFALDSAVRKLEALAKKA
jgi:hypothetical protein